MGAGVQEPKAHPLVLDLLVRHDPVIDSTGGGILDGLQFTAAVIQALAWPSSAVVLAVLLREPLTQLLRRAKTVEGLGAKVTLGEELAEVRETVEVALPAPTPDQEPPLLPAPAAPAPLQELTDELARTSATGAIIASWRELEDNLKDWAERNGAPWSSVNSMRVMNDWLSQGILEAGTINSILALRRIRNKVAHGATDYVATLADAAEFRSIATEIIASLPSRQKF